MNINLIKTDPDYRAELKEIESLMMATPDTPEGEKLISEAGAPRLIH